MNNNKNDVFDDISNSLNKLKREEALFNCLKIPCDEVKIEVVKCLFVVPMEDLDQPEIEQITQIMTECSNIGAGQTELVLSNVFWILTKFVQKPPDKLEEAPYIFQYKFGEISVFSALDILKRNLFRVSDVAEEEEEKITLSLSILNFLKAASKAE